MRYAVLAIWVLALVGCAGQRFSHLENTYRISDNSNERTITVAPSAGRRIWQTRGGTTGSDKHVMETYRRAAERFLAESGRVCTVGEGRQAGRADWEFDYLC